MRSPHDDLNGPFAYTLPDGIRPARKLTVFIPVSVELGLDAGWWPWLAPDSNPMPDIDLFPRITATLALVRCARRRIRAAAHLITHGPTEEITT